MADVAPKTTRASGSRRRKRNVACQEGSGSSKGPAAPSVNRETVPPPLPPTPRRRLSAVPPYGAVTDAGRRQTMEDAVDIKIGLCSPMINGGRPLHYFGVYDGHGGSHFAVMCKDNLHAILREELMNIRREHMEEERVLQGIWRSVISRVFLRTELVALRTCVCGSVGFRCNCDPHAVECSGTTAVVVVLTGEHIVVGNCGDSRAVLYRGGRVVPLSFDHKPDRADEKARIEASGGSVLNADVARVDGVLAMSRAIGDKYLKPFVISEPEVTFTKREEGDEFLIVASDGLWDVVSSRTAGLVARKCLADTVTDESPTEGSPALISASIAAAGFLCRLALARGSCDNISVMVVDLKRFGDGAGAGGNIA